MASVRNDMVVTGCQGNVFTDWLLMFPGGWWLSLGEISCKVGAIMKTFQ